MTNVMFSCSFPHIHIHFPTFTIIISSILTSNLTLISGGGLGTRVKLYKGTRVQVYEGTRVQVYKGKILSTSQAEGVRQGKQINISVTDNDECEYNITTVVPPYSLIQYPRFTADRKKILKMKEINVSQVSKRVLSENGP
jgi:hypothetical protein